MRQAQRELEASRDHYFQLYDFAPVGFMTLDHAGIIRDINATGSKILGRHQADLLQSRLLEFIVPVDHRKYQSHLQVALQRKDCITVLRIAARNGAPPTWIELISLVSWPETEAQPAFKCAFADITARKQAEDVLRESEARFRHLADTAPVMIWIAEPDLHCTYFNRPWLEFTGRTLEEESGHGWAEGVHADDRKRCWQRYTEAFRARQEFRLEYRLRRHDGQYRWVMDHGVPRFTPTGEFLGFIGACSDIHERREMEEALTQARAELETRVAERTRQLTRANAELRSEAVARKQLVEALRESEESLRLMLEGTRDYATFMLDPKGRVANWNAAAEQINGYRTTEILGKPFSCFFTRTDVQRGRPRKLLQTARTKGRVEDESWRVHKDGTRYWAGVIITALHDDAGRLRGYLTVTQDITQRKEAEEALRQNERKLADFFDHSPFGLLWVGPQGRVRRINRAGLELFGCKQTACLNRPVKEFIADAKLASDLVKRLSRREVIQNLRVQLQRADGTVRHVLVDANGLWEHGRLVYSRWFLRDITRRVELEREVLVIAERERQRIGRELHDDLCQQLTGIEFLSQTLARQLSEQSPRNARSAREIARMLRQALTHTHELAHGLSPAELETDGLITALQELARRTGKLFQITCRFRCRATPGLNHDPALGIHLYRITQEAVSNAIKHGKAQRVDIGLTRNKHRLVLAVRDNGCGLPAKAPRRKGMGLRVMQYRAGVISGTLVLQRNSTGGTTVVCSVSDAFIKPKTKILL